VSYHVLIFFWLYLVMGYPLLCHTNFFGTIFRHFPTYTIVRLHGETSGASRILCKSGLGVHMANYIFVSSRNLNSSTLEPDRPQNDSSLSPVLSLSSILPPPSSHCAFIYARKILECLPKCYYSFFIFKHFVSLNCFIRRVSVVCSLN
jgi:hypothetical protein